MSISAFGTTCLSFHRAPAYENFTLPYRALIPTLRAHGRLPSRRDVGRPFWFATARDGMVDDKIGWGDRVWRIWTREGTLLHIARKARG